MPDLRIKIDGTDTIENEWNLRPAQIRSASRLTVNQVVRELQQDLGRSIPKQHGTSIAGFKRVRAKKTLAKAKTRKRIQGITWIGRNAIAAAYAGKPRNVTGGARAGKYFFENAFVATMKSGHTGIFKRIKGSTKIVEQTVDLDQAQSQVRTAVNKKRGRISQILRQQLEKKIK